MKVSALPEDPFSGQDFRLIYGRLTKKQRIIFLAHKDLSVADKSVEELAPFFDITGPTLRRHLNNIYTIVGIRGRTGLIWLACHTHVDHDWQVPS